MDSGAFSSAPTPAMREKIKSSAPQSNKYLDTNPFHVAKVANATHAKTLDQIEITFTLTSQVFTKKFLLLPKTNNPILGLPFYRNNRILTDVASQKLHRPEISLQISELTMRNGKTKTKSKKHKNVLKTITKLDIFPISQETIDCFLDNILADNKIGIVDPNSRFESSIGLRLTSSFSKIQSSKSPIVFLNVTPNVVSVPKGAVVARFTILTPKQAKYLQPIDAALFNIDSSDINELVDISNRQLLVSQT